MNWIFSAARNPVQGCSSALEGNRGTHARPNSPFSVPVFSGIRWKIEQWCVFQPNLCMESQQGSSPARQTSPRAQPGRPRTENEISKEATPSRTEGKQDGVTAGTKMLHLLPGYVQKMWIKQGNLWPFSCRKSEKQVFSGYMQSADRDNLLICA